MIGNIANSVLYLGLGQGELLIKGSSTLASQTDDGQAVGTVVQDIKVKGDFVQAQNGSDVVAGLAVLVQDKNTVVDAVGELSLLSVQVSQSTDGVGLGVVSNHVTFVQVLAVGIGAGSLIAQIQAGMVDTIALSGALQYLGSYNRAKDLVAGLNVSGNGGLFGIQRLIIVQQGSSSDDTVGEITLLQLQLFERAQHTVGRNTAQFALFDFDAAGQGRLVQSSGNQITHMNVPGTGNNLNGLILADVDLADPHMVRVGMTLHRDDLTNYNIGNLIGRAFPAAHHGTGHGHISSILLGGNVMDAHIGEIFQPTIR